MSGGWGLCSFQGLCRVMSPWPGISCHSGKAINDSKILIVLSGRSFGRRSNLSETFCLEPMRGRFLWKNTRALRGAGGYSKCWFVSVHPGKCGGKMKQAILTCAYFFQMGWNHQLDWFYSSIDQEYRWRPAVKRSQPLTGRSRQLMTRWHKKKYQRNSDTRVAVLNAWGTCMMIRFLWSSYKLCLLLGCDLSNIIESQAISDFLWWKQIFLKWVDNGISNNLPSSSRESLRVVKAFRKFCLAIWCCPCFLAQDPSWVGCGRAASVLWVGVFDGFCCQTWNQSLRFFAVCIAKMHVCHPLISITWFLNTTPASFAPNRLIFYLWSTL